MPSSINGIGSHYYGKKNVKSHRGVCEGCGQEALLSSYDTGEYVIVLYLPVFPLGKKHIIDECGRCTRHRVVDLKKWEQLRAETIEEALKEFRAHPGSGEKAVRLHGVYRYFSQSDEAAQMREFMEQKLAGDGDVQCHLGRLLNEENRENEASEHFERALALKPDDPAIRLAAGTQRLEQGRLPEAHQLLRSYEQDQPERNPGVLLALAHAYQRQGQHEESLRLLKLAGEKDPEVLKDKQVRSLVKSAESALGREETALPSSGRGPWPWLLGAAAVVLTLTGFFLIDHYFAQNRRLYIVNGSERAVTVTIDGQSYELKDRGPLEISLPEGTHRASYTGDIEGQTDFTIESGLVERFGHSTVYVLNPGGEAVLGHETMEYARKGSSANAAPAQYQIRYGKDLERFEDIDYAFGEFPEELRVERSVRIITKRRIELVKTSAREIFDWLIEEKRKPEALKFAERHLRRRPEDTALLSAYVDAADDEKRIRALLQQGCAERPLHPRWHELWQDQEVREGRLKETAEAYNALLKDDPRNPDLLCLRARLELSCSASLELVRRALEANPGHATALQFLAYRLASGAEWAEARSHALKALEAKPSLERAEEVLFASCLALGEYDELEKHLRERIKREPGSYAGRERLQFVLIARKNSSAIQVLRNDYRQALKRAKYSEKGIRNCMDGLEAIQFYAEGRYEELLKNHGNKNNDKGGWRFEALIGLNRLDEAEDLFESDPSLVGWFNLLTLSVAHRAKGDDGRADALLADAQEHLLDGDAWDVAAGGALTIGNTPAPERLEQLVMHYREKALLAVALAQREPQHAARLLGLARKLNVPRFFPYHLIQQLTEAAK